MNSNNGFCNKKIIGLTGGIGTGKSTAAAYLAGKGFAVIDADQIGRDMTADGSTLLETLDALFGPAGPYGYNGIAILKEPGVLDRQAMAKLVFNDAETRDKFNEVMFSAIIDKIRERILAYMEEDNTGILVDAPLLFESGANELCDAVILITADLEVRIARVQARDHMSREEILDRIRNQMDDAEKARLADYVIDNSCTVEDLFEQLDDLFVKLK